MRLLEIGRQIFGGKNSNPFGDLSFVTWRDTEIGGHLVGSPVQQPSIQQHGGMTCVCKCSPLGKCSKDCPKFFQKENTQMLKLVPEPIGVPFSSGCGPGIE